jgi:hypothetical protein
MLRGRFKEGEEGKVDYLDCSIMVVNAVMKVGRGMDSLYNFEAALEYPL